MMRDALAQPWAPPRYSRGIEHGKSVWPWLFWVCRNPYGLVEDMHAENQRHWAAVRVHRLRGWITWEVRGLPWDPA